MSSNYDYFEAKRMTDKIPNLNKTFTKLATTHTPRFLLAHKFVYFFFLGCGTLFVANTFNINLIGANNEFVHQFRIRPDFITGERSVSYRKQEKEFRFY